VERLSDQAQAWLDPAVDFVLVHGLADLTLRPLAAALGTSDRMVIYHFGSKERLVSRIVERASERLGASIVELLTPPPATSYDVVMRFWHALTAEETEPYVRLYIELWTAAALEPTQYAAAVRQISADWLALVEHLFQSTGERLAPGVAVDTLATLDGLILVRGALGSGVDADAAARRFAAALARRPAPKRRGGRGQGRQGGC
jgi:AcrR family transcriptional regulator